MGKKLYNIVILYISLVNSGVNFYSGFPGGSVVKNPPANAGDMDSVPRSRRSPGEENGNPLQCSWLGNPMDRGEPVRLQSMGHKRVRHDLAAKQ